jgi:DNA-binding IclR family transcriptional regulator
MVQQAVLANALIGASNSQIAKDLNIDRATVKRILSASDMQHHIEIGRSDCVRMIPKSVRVIRQRLEKGSETAALSILRGTQVLINQPLTVNQSNIVANTWITMRAQKAAEAQQTLDVTPISSESPANTTLQPDPPKD